MMDWRLGIDLGTNSLGWAALHLVKSGDGWAPDGIVAAGSRIFSDGRDPKSGASLAVDRREARAMRRRRDRFQQRQRALMTHLVADGLFPADPAARKALEELDPYELRARALDEPLTLPELGRAIWHLNQRRGFKSNRKTDKPDKPGDDSGKIKTGVGRLRAEIDRGDARTFGEWLHLRRQRKTEEHPDGLSVRTRLRAEQGDDAKGMGYDFYPDRDLLEEEFNELWSAQESYHPDVLTPDVRARLFEIVFHQRPLKQPKIGTDTFGTGEPRLAKAHPLFQRRRLLEELNALKIVRVGQVAERLTPEQRDLLLSRLKGSGKMSFAAMRKALRLEHEARFNKESGNRTDLKGDEVAAVMGAKTRFAERWLYFSPDEQWSIVERLEAVQTDAELASFRDWVAGAYGLTPERASAVATARLPQGFGRFGETVTRELIDALGQERDADGRVIVYSEAVERLGRHHSDFRTGEILAELPYYGEVLDRHIMPGSGDASEPDVITRVGRLTNPTVHIGLNQVRRTVNRLIARYGPPREIAVELARELKLTDDEKKKRSRENNDNRQAAERRGRMLDEIGIENSGENRAKLRLWEELDGDNVMGRACVYSGEVISIRRLFSPEVEVDHILPFKDTLDDSNGNKIVCMQLANRYKRKRSPWQTWGGTAAWEGIAERASRLPRGKRRRFEPDAMERYKEEAGFLPRQLVDTQYLSRLAREYMASLYPDKGDGSSNVWVSPGQLTEMVRRKLGLNDLLDDHNIAGGKKNRLDHRHHAIDAIVIGVVDRGMLQQIARASGLEGEEGRERIIIPEPWDGFRDEVRTTVRAIVTSHRADHGTAGHGTGSTAGRLHNDTAYGLTRMTDASGNTIVVRRKPLAGLRPADLVAIRDPDLRAALHRATEGLDGKAFERALAEFSRTGPLQFRGTRHVRVTEPLTVILIRDARGTAYKGYKGDSNYRYDVWEMPDGKWVTHWRDRDGTDHCGIVSMFDAHQARLEPRPHPAARKVLSLHQDDLVVLDPEGGERRLMRVVKFGQNGQITLAGPNEAGDLKRRDATANDEDYFKYVSPTAGGLKKARARQVRIDELGQVRDPGFPARKAVRPTRPKPPTVG
ncbi:type II CRISPR RNA-guided endonuclease Cas9 [uncultured Sphingomonas sp.]|uniref:type II CRISPR RNA-guided endonuclease Cas9 n=1 Tax=uncultured Sphingomonas sp. TaxID=158754 RepID=UPI0035C97AB0